MSESRRVLIVDDEEDITWGIARSLARTPSVEVQCVHSGDAALKLLEDQRFDVVLSDIRMPGPDGLQLMLDIRQHHPQTRVIIMTAYGSHQLKEEVEARGGFFYIEKPFDVGYLKQIVLDALELDDNGFKGCLDNAGIRDLVRFNCSKKRSASLILRRNGEQGTIFFKDGDIVHAECGELTGERAFYRMLNWDGGTFTIVSTCSETDRTISRDWQLLLHQSH